MNNTLMKAILAMDAYNRGYQAGIKFEEPAASLGKKIGNATIIQQSDVVNGSPGVSTGFYAIAYTYGTEKIISYRGTDEVPTVLNPFTADVWNGYGVGGMSPWGKQAEMAVKFYQSIAGTETKRCLPLSSKWI